ncbi:hypothetical protein DFJ73DRAFT_772328 [Zopfochytrium polystomum]|nr:hypothetical protein DFJ73DRAFT_772328 [Zopfochytrium polystomum]
MNFGRRVQWEFPHLSFDEKPIAGGAYVREPEHDPRGSHNVGVQLRATDETATLLLSVNRGWSREEVELHDEPVHGSDGYYPSYSGHDVILVCMDLSVSGTVRSKRAAYLEGYVLRDIAREAPRTPLLFDGFEGGGQGGGAGPIRTGKAARRFTNRSDRCAECIAVTFEGVLEVFELAVRRPASKLAQQGSATPWGA